MNASALTLSALRTLPLAQAASALSALPKTVMTPDLQRANDAVNVLMQPQMADRYAEVPTEKRYTPVSKPNLADLNLEEAAKEVLAPGALTRKPYLPVLLFANLSVVAASFFLPDINNAVHSALDLPAQSQPLDGNGLLKALGLGTAGGFLAAALGSILPMQPPITVRWQYATPAQRARDYLKVAATNGIVGFQQLTLAHFPKSVFVNEVVSPLVEYGFQFGLFSSFMYLNSKSEIGLEDAVTAFANGLIMATGQVYCARAITNSLAGKPVLAAAVRLLPGFLFFLASGTLKSPDIYEKLGEMVSEEHAQALQYLIQGGVQSTFSLSVFGLTLLGLSRFAAKKASA